MPHARAWRVEQVEVVEQPLDCRVDDVSAVHVVGQDAVGPPQEVQVLVQPRQDVVPARASGRAPA